MLLRLQVRDQRVRLLPSTDKGLLVEVVGAADKHAALQQGVKPQQFMMSFTMRDWQIMKQLVPPHACMMPHRGKVSDSPVSDTQQAADSSKRSTKRAKKQ